MEKTRTYSELILLPTFKERLEYLMLGSVVGNETFGWDRYFNQKFYHDPLWKSIRSQIIIRDNGCDLAIEDFVIIGKIIVHHMNPIDIHDITERTEFLLRPEYLICVSDDTHTAIHYGKEIVLPSYAERKPNDTCPWKA